MRSVVLWLTSALLAALVSGGAAVSQPPLPKKDGGFQRDGGPGRPGTDFIIREDGGGPGRLGADDVVARIMAFDKNKDGKVTKDELPERMHDLIAKGDTNKDGALDQDEIKKLATASGPASVGFGRREFGTVERVAGGFQRGTGAGSGPGGPIGSPVPVGPGPRGAGLGLIEGVVDDLKLSAQKKDEARIAVKAHQENVQKLMEQARTDLVQKMKKILSEEEFKDFQAALDRPTTGTFIIDVGPPDAPRPADAEKRLEQLQKELDELKRQLRR